MSVLSVSRMRALLTSQPHQTTGGTVYTTYHSSQRNSTKQWKNSLQNTCSQYTQVTTKATNLKQPKNNWPQWILTMKLAVWHQVKLAFNYKKYRHRTAPNCRARLIRKVNCLHDTGTFQPTISTYVLYLLRTGWDFRLVMLNCGLSQTTQITKSWISTYCKFTWIIIFYVSKHQMHRSDARHAPISF